MGNLVFQATLGGQVNLVGPNTASTFNLNVPAVAGTLVTTGDTGTVTNTMLAGSIANAKLSNSSVTIGGTSIALGASSSTITNDLSISGLTVGKGAGSVSTNTVFGVSALASNSSGLQNTAVGYQAAYSSTNSYVTAFGYQSAYSTSTGQDVVAFGWKSLYANTTGSSLVGVGDYALTANTTGSNNVALGHAALASNTTASNNTAVGYQALYTNSTSTYNTALGYQAGYTAAGNAGAGNNTFIGVQAGYYVTSGNGNTFVGNANGAGFYVTTGSNNTILGGYTGNQNGLDIRTSSNYIVLSDGAGNPWGYLRGDNSAWYFGIATTSANNSGAVVTLNGSSASGWQPLLVGKGNGTTYWFAGTKGNIDSSTSTAYEIQVGGSGGVYVSSGGTSWTSASDERLKDIIEPITDGANKVSTLRAVIGKYKTDPDGTRRPFLIAQDVQIVLPEAVDSSSQIKGDDTEYLGVSYTEVIPLLVAAIKELKAELDTAKEQIAALQGAAK